MKRIRPSVGSAHVIAMIALFAALGGGYAAAFSGSGTLQKAAVDGFDNPAFKDIRTLNGFGVLKARCDSGADAIFYRFENKTSTTIDLRFFHPDTGDFRADSFDPGVQIDQYSSGDNRSEVRFHLSKPATGNKAQVDIAISNTGPIANACDSAVVRVLALNTVE